MGRIEREVLKMWSAGDSYDSIAQAVGVLTRDVAAILKEHGFGICAHCGKRLNGSIERCSNDGFCELP